MDADEFPASLGSRLLADGWRQCSLIRPDAAHFRLLPPGVEFDPSRERLMLVTQSCSICGPSPKNERFVEVMVVEMLPEILSRHGQARKGAMTRELVLDVTKSPDYCGLRCDIDRRFFLPRERLLSCKRDEALVEPRQLLNFQGWMAKYYARVAVPTELVERLKRSGFQDAMKKALDRRFSQDGKGPRLHEAINRIYIRWEPDDELGRDEGAYTVWLIVACDSEDLVEDVDQRILEVPHFSNDELAREGVDLKEPKVVWAGNLTLLAVDGYSRLGSWDALTGLEDHALVARSE